MNQIYKYPRTHHIEGSKFQAGDEDLDSVPFKALQGKYLVIEEKMDGANSAVSFSDTGELLLQSRGHYLTGGAREKHFNLFKRWANAYKGPLGDLLKNRYVMYGEWLYAKHTVFYTDLPHYFMEFDIYDKKSGWFLNTGKRTDMLQPFPFVKSVKVLYDGAARSKDIFNELLADSFFIAKNNLSQLKDACTSEGLDFVRISQETDNTTLMEGLYIKVEDDNHVTERYKYVRASFLTSVTESESHWLNRPILPNRLAPGIDIFNM